MRMLTICSSSLSLARELPAMGAALEGRTNQARRDDDHSTNTPSQTIRVQVRQPQSSVPVPVGDRVPNLAVYCGG